MSRSVFKRKGPLALAASAWGQEYELVQPAAPTVEGAVAVVMIMGPLTHHGDWWGGDTYDGIEQRVKAALETSASTVVLKIDSPGGEVDGAFECARTLRRMALDAGKRIVAYVDEFAASAAYALACSANSIYLPEAGQLGSIGVIDCVFDDTAHNTREGFNVAVFTSGKAKADGNPNTPLTDEVRARVQSNVDGLAGLFFQLVAESRGIDAGAMQMMEAAMFRGQNAVDAKLADGVANWEQLLAIVAGGESVTAAEPVQAASGEKETSMKYAELLAAIKAALAEDAPAPEPAKEGEDEMDAAGFKAALKGLFAEEPAPPPAPHKEPDGDEGPAPVKPSDNDEDNAKKAAAAPAPAAAAPAPVAQAAAVPSVNPEVEEAKLALLDSRPDLNADERKALAGESIATVRKVLAFRPRPGAAPAPAPVVNPAAAAMVTGTQGGTGRTGAPSANTDLNKQMGIYQPQLRTHRDGTELVCPAVSQDQAKARLAELLKEGGAK